MDLAFVPLKKIKYASKPMIAATRIKEKIKLFDTLGRGC
jgi:hypothetical protein